MRNEKLVGLLKGDFSRSKFVDNILATGKISEQTDTRNLMVKVD